MTIIFYNLLYQQQTYVQGHLDGEGQICVELARFMEPDKALLGDTEHAWNAYHACAIVDDADALLAGGTSEVGTLQYRITLQKNVCVCVCVSVESKLFAWKVCGT
jgi:hypothetical protein